MGESGEDPARGQLGARHARARELARRRSRGEELSDDDSRVLEAHLVACPRCREWAAEGADEQVEATVPGGQEDSAGATVGTMEAATPDSGRDQGHIGSQKDAMGRDKHREVVGHSYGPSKARQLLYYGIFAVFVILAYIGAKIAVDELDKAPANNPDKAPWSRPESPQTPPQQFQ
jgi:anti-sigma factor RsiW